MIKRTISKKKLLYHLNINQNEYMVKSNGIRYSSNMYREITSTEKREVVLTNEMLEEELEGTIIGAIDHHKYQDESTRRDANTTGRTTGLSFQPMLFQSTAIEHLINEAENSVSHRSKEEKNSKVQTNLIPAN